MRGIVLFLALLMFLLLGNIFAYSMSENYRFFLKKIKYNEELVYEWSEVVNDSLTVSSWDSSTGWWAIYSQQTLKDPDQDVTFLDVLSWTTKTDSDLPEMTQEENNFIDEFWTFNLKRLETHTNIFGITTEYPDPYYEWYSAGVSVYVLSTLSYTWVKDVFDVLAFDLPYRVNEVNNFWTASFYINLLEWYEDNYVRIVMEYENNVFWLKIRKDRYNEVKWILEALSS